MKLEKRFMLEFLIGVFFLAFLLSVSIIAFFYFAASMKTEEREALLPEATMKNMVKDTIWRKGVPILPSSWENRLKQRGEWVQIVNEVGMEVYRYNTPDSVPRRYSPFELVQSIWAAQAEGELVHTWYDSQGSKTYTWIWGRSRQHELLQRIQEQTRINGQKLMIPLHLLREVKERKGWLQIVDEQGAEKYQFQKPPSIPTQYSPGEFVRATRQGSDLHMTIGQLNGKTVTWILKDSLPVIEKKRNQQIAGAFFISLLLTILAFAAFTYRFGKKLGAPLWHLIDWLRNLSRGIYHEPNSKRGPTKNLNTGQWNKPYTLYQEVFEMVEGLSLRLQQTELERQRLDQTREEWIAGVSHDLKTPLSSIRGYAELYRSPSYAWSKEEIEEYLDLIIRKTGDIQHLIDDLNLTFRIKNNALPLNLHEIDMKEFLRILVADLLNTMNHETDITLDLPSNSAVVYPIDPQWFKRALLNLLENAVVHNKPHTPITVKLQVITEETARSFPALEIEVVDQGSGMDEQTVSQLFKRYYQGVQPNSATKGTGLGMAIAKQLIELHGGTIDVISQIGYGTRIKICLPEKPIHQKSE